MLKLLKISELISRLEEHIEMSLRPLRVVELILQLVKAGKKVLVAAASNGEAIAAFVEAYWSSMTLTSPLIKYIVGALLWLIVAAYFAFAGRAQHAAE